MRVEGQFTGSSKAYVNTLIKRLVSEKYTGGEVREHILRLTNIAAKLKPMEMALPEAFVVHVIFASCPKEFETFTVNYNSQLEYWGIEKLIAMCVQEEDRIKAACGDSINHVKQGKKRSFYTKKSKPPVKPHWDSSSSSRSHGKAPMDDNHDHHQKASQKKQVDKHTCFWCHQKGYYQKDCVIFLRHLAKNGIPYEEDLAKRRKNH
ncbi:uncharacterized protein LOC101782924 [Setaria italica]|uniref:uncharacterized protein LOC101782924 n=1 Tax=Setaria italica TaxID=4555 RepID=UPI0003509F63|nr:uncharacterized protein LOC101782924 [Setaria italica]